MNFSENLKRITRTACICFTIAAVFYSAAMYFTYMSVEDEVLLDAYRLLMFFPFAVLLALGNEIIFHTSINKATRVALHYPINIAGFYLFVYAPATQGATITGENLIVILALLSAIYAIVMGIGALIYKLISKRGKAEAAAKEAASYSPLFKGISSK